MYSFVHMYAYILTYIHAYMYVIYECTVHRYACMHARMYNKCFDATY